MNSKIMIFIIFTVSTLLISACTQPAIDNQDQIDQTNEDTSDVIVCTADWNPVCGVDGVTYANLCSAGDKEIAFEGQCEKNHICTEEEKSAEMCTLEYMPVCGNDGVTYGNDCSACASGIDSWTEGEC